MSHINKLTLIRHFPAAFKNKKKIVKPTKFIFLFILIKFIYTYVILASGYHT